MAVRVAFVVGRGAPLYVLAVVGARARELRAPGFARFALGWLAASGWRSFVGGRFFGHYFHQLTAPLAVLAAPVAVALWAAAIARVFVAALAVPAAIFLVLGALHDPLMRAAGEPDPDYAQRRRAGSMRTRAPDDAICIWGNSPVLYFDADRPLGCRFVFANYLTGLSPATPTPDRSDTSTRRRTSCPRRGTCSRRSRARAGRRS